MTGLWVGPVGTNQGVCMLRVERLTALPALFHSPQWRTAPPLFTSSGKSSVVFSFSSDRLFQSLWTVCCSSGARVLNDRILLSLHLEGTDCMPGTVLRTLLTHLILIAALGSIGTDVASVHSDAELSAQDPHGKCPSRMWTRISLAPERVLQPSASHALSLLTLAFSLTEASTFLSPTHPPTPPPANGLPLSGCSRSVLSTSSAPSPA